MKLGVQALFILFGTFVLSAVHAGDETDFKGLLVEAASHLEGFGSHSQAEVITNLAGAAKAVVIIPDEIAASIVGHK